MAYANDSRKYAVDELDGETVVMDTVGGRLFLLEEAASLLWSPLASGTPLESLLEAVETRYGSHRRGDVEAFVDRLVDEGLLEATSEPSNGAPVEWPEHLGEFRVTSYDDMSDIITMDPIHDVNPAKGWPFKEPRRGD